MTPEMVTRAMAASSRVTAVTLVVEEMADSRLPTTRQVTSKCPPFPFSFHVSRCLFRPVYSRLPVSSAVLACLFCTGALSTRSLIECFFFFLFFFFPFFLLFFFFLGVLPHLHSFPPTITSRWFLLVLQDFLSSLKINLNLRPCFFPARLLSSILTNNTRYPSFRFSNARFPFYLYLLPPCSLCNQPLSVLLFRCRYFGLHSTSATSRLIPSPFLSFTQIRADSRTAVNHCRTLRLL